MANDRTEPDQLTDPPVDLTDEQKAAAALLLDETFFDLRKDHPEIDVPKSQRPVA